MSATRSWALQRAVHGRLVTLMAEADGGAPVPVTDHAPERERGPFLRHDGYSAVELGSRGAPIHEHRLMVHAFDRPRGQRSRSRGQRRAKALIAAVIDGLRHWEPFAGEGCLAFEQMAVSTDEDGATAHAWARFSIILGDA